MMLDRPDAIALLEEARHMLMETLLPQLPADCRYGALMVANAIGIAAREADQSESAVCFLLAELSALLGAACGERASAGELAGQLADLEHRLALKMRSGEYDEPGPIRDAIRRYLLASATARVRIANPRALTSPGPAPR